MNTYLGSCTELALADVTPGTIGRPRILLLEGYVWDIAEGPALAARAMEIASRAGATVALSLSDAWCVERHRESFQAAVRDSVDIVIANESEIVALQGVSRFEDAETDVAQYGGTFVLTRSEQGSVIVSGDERVVQPAIAVSKVVDTTGAGDAYSAGFLYGWASEWTLADCAKLATYCASQVIRQVGARIPPGLLESYGAAASSSGTMPSG